MFTDQSFEPTEFTPTVSSEKVKASNAAQTEEVVHKSDAVQTSKSQNAQVQTSPKKEPGPSEVDLGKLAAFLNKVTPDLLKALDEIHDTNTIDAFERISLSDSVPQIRLLAKLSTLEPSNSRKKISGLCWSINGGILAVSYSVLSHDAWCDHLSEIRLYEFTRQDKLQIKQSYETNSCCTGLSYHPTEPSILAAGLYNGDVIVWNFRDETSVIPTTICTHNDAVSALLWRPRTTNDPSLLITSSSDGYIFVHKLTTISTNMTLHRKFKIAREHNPAENSRPRSAGGRRERAVEPGLSITCFDFCSKQPEIFIVGTQCGGLYKCSMEAVTSIQGDDTTIDPVIGEFSRSKGTVTCIKCSLANNIFVASDTNKEMHVFDISTTSILLAFTLSHTVTGLQWIISSQDIILAHGADSNVTFFDVMNGTIYRDLKIETTRINTACVDFSQKRDTVAIADTQGNLDLWKIPKLNTSVFTSQKNN